MRESTPNKVRDTNGTPERILRAIEQLEHSPLREHERVIVLLTYAGLKRVGEISWTVTDASEQKRIDVMGIITDLGLQCHLATQYLVKEKKRKEYVIFGREPVLLEQLHGWRRDNIDNMEPYKFHSKFGEAFGYPRTAIDAFIRDDCLDALPDQIADTPVGRFYQNAVGMRLSRSHWQEELKTVQKWMHAVEQLSPEIYRQSQTGDDSQNGTGTSI